MSGPTSPPALVRRFVPLEIAIGLQGMMLWVPVEKLFMSQIGFTPATIGLMAAAYAAVVPLLEIPSGILADRWSRNLLMVLASGALLVSSAVGAASHDVTTYVLAALALGVFFALNSGTVDSMVYDTVVEETGSSDLYETWIGRIRMVESGALVVSALAGGVLADWTSARFTYVATLPFTALAMVAFLRFREPHLHQAAEPTSLRAHVGVTLRTMTTEPAVRRVMLLSAIAAMLAQSVFEFGPVWLVALAAPAVLFGPYWAALVSTLGIGGFLTSRLPLDRAVVTWTLALLLPVVTLPLALTDNLAAVVVAQALLALGLAVIGIHAGRLLHDAVPSEIRTGVASGVGTLAWVVFLPSSLLLGWLARAHGVRPAGWALTGVALVVGALLVLSQRQARRAAPPAPDDVACRELVELVTGYLDDVLPPPLRDAFDLHLRECDGCTDYLAQVRATIAALGRVNG